MDIEKAEALALRGAQRILAKHNTTWFIALHGEQMKSECLSQLNQHNYIISHRSPAEIWATVR